MSEFEQKLQTGQSISVYPEIAFAINLARRIARAVRPVYGMKQNDVPINEISHDFNYALDVKAEDAVKTAFQRAWKKGLLYGYVTEDQGMVLPPREPAEWMFLIDPVDGSRPTNIGAEMACVNIARVPGNIPNPTLRDVESGVALAIKERKIFIARKEQGVYEVRPAITGNGRLVQVKAKENVTSELRDVSLVYETYSMSAELTGIVIDPLLKEASFKTEYPSGSYSALTLIRGQNELHADLRRRLVLEYPDLPVMLRELGMIVTDAFGGSLEDAKLWQFNADGSWSDEIQLSWVAAASPTLHQKAMEKIEEGFVNLSQKYPRP